MVEAVFPSLRFLALGSRFGRVLNSRVAQDE